VPERSYYLSGLSKSVSPGLRTAFVVAPSAEESSRLRAALVSLGQFPAPIAAAAAAAAVDRGIATAAAAAMRRGAAARWTVAADILPELQSGADTTNHFGWLRLPARWRGDAFATRVRALGVEVTPASAFAVTPGLSVAAVRVCLGAPATLKQLAGGLEVLAATLAEDPAVIRVYY
jgi:DNA-binding transcriptional MocR family regulator